MSQHFPFSDKIHQKHFSFSDKFHQKHFPFSDKFQQKHFPFSDKTPNFAGEIPTHLHHERKDIQTQNL